jgi:3-methyladenine DNA glycosylase AlkD
MKSKKDEYASEVVLEIVKKNLIEKDKINSHDLLQKASGWMLREYGKRISEKRLKEFLTQNFNLIKTRRTLLRYAIEKFDEKERKEWLNRE